MSMNEPIETYDFMPDTAATVPTPKSKAPKNTPIKKILNQITLNPDITTAEIAENCNVSRQAIRQMLIRYGIDDKCLESFKKSRADIFAGIQETVAASLSEADIKKASVRDRTILLGTLYDKERLERGQSTSNQSVFFRIIEESDHAE